MAKRTILLDGDILAFQVAVRLETPINWGADEETGVDLWTLHADPEAGCQQMDRWLDDLMEKLEGDDLVIALLALLIGVVVNSMTVG